jgi:hypothetical protein
MLATLIGVAILLKYMELTRGDRPIKLTTEDEMSFSERALANSQSKELRNRQMAFAKSPPHEIYLQTAVELAPELRNLLEDRLLHKENRLSDDERSRAEDFASKLEDAISQLTKPAS